MDTAPPATDHFRHERRKGARPAPRSLHGPVSPRLIVPGLRDSGPAHWQSEWQRSLSGSHRVQQDDWETPDVERWGAAVARAIDATRSPPVIIAHSFGCLAAVHAMRHYRRPVAAVFLVAPADPDRFGVDKGLPRQPLGVPATLVASSNDPWLRLTSAGQLAMRWRARFVACPGAGHINAESGYGPWPEGLELLAQLEQAIAAPVDDCAAASW